MKTIYGKKTKVKKKKKFKVKKLKQKIKIIVLKKKFFKFYGKIKKMIKIKFSNKNL